MEAHSNRCVVNLQPRRPKRGRSTSRAGTIGRFQPSIPVEVSPGVDPFGVGVSALPVGGGGVGSAASLRSSSLRSAGGGAGCSDGAGAGFAVSLRGAAASEEVDGASRELSRRTTIDGRDVAGGDCGREAAVDPPTGGSCEASGASPVSPAAAATFGSERTEKLVVVSTFEVASVVGGASTPPDSVPRAGAGPPAEPSVTTSNCSARRAAPSASPRQEDNSSIARQLIRRLFMFDSYSSIRCASRRFPCCEHSGNPEADPGSRS